MFYLTSIFAVTKGVAGLLGSRDFGYKDRISVWAHIFHGDKCRLKNSHFFNIFFGKCSVWQRRWQGFGDYRIWEIKQTISWWHINLLVINVVWKMANIYIFFNCLLWKMVTLTKGVTGFGDYRIWEITQTISWCVFGS